MVYRCGELAANTNMRKGDDMRTLLTLGAVLALALVSTGCNTLSKQPRIREAGVAPEVLEPGDIAIMTLRIRDRFNVVDQVYGEIEGYDQGRFSFRDDGVAPDEAAGDGIWTSDADVPLDAPPGSFTLIVTAFDSRGNPIEVKTEEGRRLLQTTIDFHVDSIPLDELDRRLQPAPDAGEMPSDSEDE